MQYTAVKVGPLGDHDPKYGQRFWGTVEEAQMPVSFNMMNPVNIETGATIEYEERTIKETKAGKEYAQLRKVKISGSPSVPTPEVSSKESSSSAASGQWKLIMSKLNDMHKDIKELKGETTPQIDNVVEDIGDDPIDTSSIPF